MSPRSPVYLFGLVAEREPAGLPSLEDALRVGVPPPRRVALGGDQDVVGEREHLPAAERA